MERLSEIPMRARASVFSTVCGPGVLYAYGLLFVICLNFMQAEGHDRQRVIELVLLFAGGCVLAFRPTPIWNRTGQGLRRAVAAFFALGVLSSMLALSPRHAWFDISSFFLLLVTGLAIGDGLARERSSLVRVLQAFGAVASLYALKICCIYVSVWLLAATPDLGDFTPGFSNIRHFNHVETVALPFLVLLYLLTPATSRLRMLWMASLSIWWAVLFVTGGRGTEVGLAAASLVTLGLLGRLSRPFLLAMLLSFAIGMIVYEFAFVLLPVLMGRAPFGDAGAVLARTMADPSSGRTVLWKCALGLIDAHPWLGVGPLHFAHEHAGAAHPHDWMLQIAAEWGLPALLAFSCALWFAFRGLWRARTRIAPADTSNQNVLTAWILIGAALVVDASVSGSIVMPQSQLMIVLYIACATGWTWSFQSLPAQARHATASRVLAIVVVFALAYAVAPQFVARAMNEQPTAAELAVNGRGEWWPRLWRGGYF